MAECVCTDCEFWVKASEPDGWCHRYPVAKCLPASWWCGEFRLRVVEESVTPAEFKVGDRVEVIRSRPLGVVSKVLGAGAVQVATAFRESELRHAEEGG